jgi:hypothetical protein
MQWKNLAQMGASSTYTNHEQTSTIVCVSHVQANQLSSSELDGYRETNISLSSSNYANTITNDWPKGWQDCHNGYSWSGQVWDSALGAYVKYC